MNKIVIFWISATVGVIVFGLPEEIGIAIIAAMATTIYLEIMTKEYRNAK